jgi:hypothetical protein
MYIDSLRIGVGIDQEASNAPMIFDCWVSTEEMKENGPQVRSALPQHERMKVDFLGGWSTALF